MGGSERNKKDLNLICTYFKIKSVVATLQKSGAGIFLRQSKCPWNFFKRLNGILIKASGNIIQHIEKNQQQGCDEIHDYYSSRQEFLTVIDAEKV